MTASEARKARRADQRIRNYSIAQGAEPQLEQDVPPELLQVSSMDEYIDNWSAEIYALSLTRRRWTGLPNGVSPRFLEKTLSLYGAAVIYKDGQVNGEDHYAAQYLGTLKPFDAQEELPVVFGMGADGQQSKVPLTPANSVTVYDNLARIPITHRVHMWARDLARIDLERSRNIAMQNAYSLLCVDKADIADAKRVVTNSNTGIFGQLAISRDNGDNSLITPQTIQTGVQPIMDKLTAALSAKLNEVYCQLGIDYVPHEKNERLVQSEATVGADVVDRHRYYYLAEAERAADQMHKVFGTDTQVEWNAGGDRDGIGTDTGMAE